VIRIITPPVDMFAKASAILEDREVERNALSLRVVPTAGRPPPSAAGLVPR
jgi:hypothetical protein